MAQTRIKYKNDKGFWIPEACMEIVSNYICEAFEQRGLDNRPEWYMDLYDDFEVARKGVLIGMLVILFESTIPDAVGEQEFVSVLNDAKEILSKAGKEISTEKLNEFEDKKPDKYFSRKWSKPMQVKDLVKVLDILTQMMNGVWEETDYEVKFEH
jgi:hypothetical protein